MKHNFTFALALVVAMAVGCSEVDFNVESDEPEWGAAQAAQAAAAASLEAGDLNQVMSIWDEQALEPAGDYRLGPGDEVSIAIFALEAPDETSTLTRTVASDGRVTLPWVRSVNVLDMTVPEAEAAICDAYEGQYLQDPQVTVMVASHVSRSVIVTGAVEEPGVYPLERNQGTLLECLSLADGLSREAGEEVTLMRLRRGTARDAPSSAPRPGDVRIVRIRLADLFSGTKPLLNVPVLAGDVVTVPPMSQQYVSVLGHVKSPGAYRLDPVKRMDALTAVAFAGGLTPSSRPDNSFLIRQAADGQHVIPVDLEEMACAEVPTLYMQPGDALIVGTSFGAWLSSVFSPSATANLSASASVLP
jgi:polysaccharide export outer membrane protein